MDTEREEVGTKTTPEDYEPRENALVLGRGSSSPTNSVLWWGFGAAAALLLAGLVFWYLAIFERSSQQAQPEETFMIGGIFPLTGDAASFGVPIQQAALLAIKEINAQGGINGRRVELVWQDGKCARENARAAAQKLLAANHIEILIAGSCSSEFLAAAPIAQARGIISVSPAATSPQISKLGKYIFRTSPSDAMAGAIAADYAYEQMGARHAALITEDKDYTQGLREIFTEAFIELGGEIVVDEVYETGESDFTEFAELVRASEADMVYLLPQSPTPGVLAVKALKDAGVSAELLTAEVLLIRDAIEEQGDILEGVTGIEVLFDTENPKAAEMLRKFEAEYGLEATYPGFMAGMYDLIYLIDEAYEATDGSAEEVAAYLYSIDGWQGALGELSFNENGDPTLPYSVRTITNHEAPIVDLVRPEMP